MMGEARDEVGMLGIADDQVVHFLGPQPDAVEVIGRGHAAPLEFAFQIVRGDRPPLDPDDGDRSDEQDAGEPSATKLATRPQRGPRRTMIASPCFRRSAAPPLGSTNPSRARPFQMRHDRFQAAPFCGQVAIARYSRKGAAWTGAPAKARNGAPAAIAPGCASGCSTPGRRASTITSWSNICSR